MVISSINNLPSHKIYGCTFSGVEHEKIVNGRKRNRSVLVRKKIYKHTLKLKGVTEEELISIVNDFTEMEMISEEAEIDVNVLTGYKNFENITGNPIFEVDTDEISFAVTDGDRWDVNINMKEVFEVYE